MLILKLQALLKAKFFLFACLIFTLPVSLITFCHYPCIFHSALCSPSERPVCGAEEASDVSGSSQQASNCSIHPDRYIKLAFSVS